MVSTPELIIAGGAALTVAFLVLGLRPRTDERLRARVESIRERGTVPLGEQQRAMERSSWRERANGRLLRALPFRLNSRVDGLVERAGSSVDASGFLVAWLAACAVAIAVVLVFMTAAEGRGAILFSGSLVLLVFAGPWLWLRRLAAKRSLSISRELPQALDLIVTNIECGLGLQAAMMVIGKKFDSPIGVEFARAMREIGAGVPREEALGAMAQRTGSDDVAGVARAIAQAERSGVSVGEILRSRAREIRERRRLTAREQANKVPVKMTIPTVLFIFPTFFLLLLGPVALNAAEVMTK